MSEIDINLKIASFLDQLPQGLTLAAIHNRLICVFGKTAWPRFQVQRYLGIATQETTAIRRSIVNSDSELMEFFTHHRANCTIDDMLILAAQQFPDRKIPSRSSLHRFLSKTRKAN